MSDMAVILLLEIGVVAGVAAVVYGCIICFTQNDE